MKKLLIKLTIKMLTWLKDSPKVNFDFNKNDVNDLQEWIDYLKEQIK